MATASTELAGSIAKAKHATVRVPIPARAAKHSAASERQIARVAQAALTASKQRVLARLRAKHAKAESDAEARLRAFVEALKSGDVELDDAARKKLRDLLANVAAERSTTSVDTLAKYIGDADLAAALTQANEHSVAWAEQRISNLITRVSDTTRKAVNEYTAAAISNGWSVDQLASELDKAWEFGADRARTIARTEMAEAETAGTLAGFDASGVVQGKGWSADELACDECADLNGVEVPLDEDFPDEGGDGPPLHPVCRCVLYAVVMLAHAADAESE